MIGQTIRLVGPMQRARAHELIDRAPDRAIVNIRPETRSSEQNAKMWAMLSDVARAKPDGRDLTTEQWKAIFMDACGHKPTFVPSLETDSFVCLGYRSSRLAKAEFVDLIECIYEYGARKGIAWSEPVPLPEERAA